MTNTHRDVREGRPHHEVEGPGLQLEDVGWREHHPDGGQEEEEDGREEGQEGFVQAAVLQSVTAVSPANHRERGRGQSVKHKDHKALMREEDVLLQDVVEAHG